MSEASTYSYPGESARESFEMIRRAGRRLSSGDHPCPWYVLDGVLYRLPANDDTVFVANYGDYHEFCASRRESGTPLPWPDED